MRKKIAIVLAAVLLILSLCSCGNKTLFDTTYTFTDAIISLPDGSIVQGAVDTWKDFDDGDQIQVCIDGVIYLVHSSNIVLIANKKGS